MSPQTPALRNTAIALALSILCCAQAPMPEPVTDQETELGDQMYKELKAKGEIVASSPLYDTLKPIADSISRAAQSRYPHPFKFFIVHEPQPNAYARGQRLCRGFLVLFREEHRAACRHAVPRSLPYNSSRRRRPHGEA
jgi:hypothetical protein